MLITNQGGRSHKPWPKKKFLKLCGCALNYFAKIHPALLLYRLTKFKHIFLNWLNNITRFINVFLVSCWPQKRFFLSYKELKLTVTILISVKLWKKRLEYDRKQGFCVSNFQSESRKTKCVCARATAYVTFIRCWITSNHTPRSSESLAHANLLLTLPMNKDAEQTHTQAKRTHTHKQKHRCVRAKTICTEQERFSIDGKNTWSEQEKIAR